MNNEFRIIEGIFMKKIVTGLISIVLIIAFSINPFAATGISDAEKQILKLLQFLFQQGVICRITHDFGSRGQLLNGDCYILTIVWSFIDNIVKFPDPVCSIYAHRQFPRNCCAITSATRFKFISEISPVFILSIRFFRSGVVFTTSFSDSENWSAPPKPVSHHLLLWLR